MSIELLADRPPWYVAGPCIGLVAVLLLATINGRLGVLGGYSDAVERVARRAPALGWRAWFLVGIVAGAVLFAAAGGGWQAGESYGWLSRAFTGQASLVVPAALFAAGALIGYGAKTAGGCTSGNGLGGCGLGSPASFAATATFMATAIATAFVTSWVFAA